MRLYVQIAGYLTDGAEHLQAVRFHFRITVAERVIWIDVLEARERHLQNLYRAVNNCTVFESINVTGMNGLVRPTRLRTCDIARFTFTVHSRFVRRAASHTRTIVFQQMLGAITHTRRTVGVLTIGVRFP